MDHYAIKTRQKAQKALCHKAPSKCECWTCSSAVCPQDDPNSNGANYDFTWDNSLTNISQYISYPCKYYHNVEQSTSYKSQAASATLVRCNSMGEFDYPSTWPQCSSTVTCTDPGNSSEITRKYTSTIKVERSTLIGSDWFNLCWCQGLCHNNKPQIKHVK